MAIQSSEQLSPREYELFNQRKEEFELQAQHAVNLKKLDIEMATLEAKWSSWIKIPVTIVKLPVLALFGVAYCISMITKKDVPEDFWKFLK